MTGDGSADEPLLPLDPAVEAALRENHREFLRFLARRLGGEQEAGEVLQEFYLKALSKAHGIRKSESVVAWLYRVLRSTLADHYRNNNRRSRLEAAYARESPKGSEAVDIDLHASVCQCLYGLLPTLRAGYAELLWRIDLVGEPRKDVARALGLSANNLTVRLHRARQALKRALLLSCRTCPEHGFFDCACNLPIRRMAAGAAA